MDNIKTNNGVLSRFFSSIVNKAQMALVFFKRSHDDKVFPVINTQSGYIRGNELADRFQKPGNRDGLGDISLAAAFPNSLFVPLHRESCDGYDGNVPQAIVFLEPLRHIQAGNLRKLDIHDDQIGAMLPRKRDGVYSVPRLQRLVAMRLKQVVEELHVKLIVLDDQNGLRHVAFARFRRKVLGRGRRFPGLPLRSRTAFLIRIEAHGCFLKKHFTPIYSRVTVNKVSPYARPIQDTVFLSTLAMGFA
jgi:hypothetical protein